MNMLGGLQETPQELAVFNFDQFMVILHYRLRAHHLAKVATSLLELFSI